MKIQLVSASNIPINFSVANVIKEIYYSKNYTIDKLLVKKKALQCYKLGDFLYLNQEYRDGDLLFKIGIYTLIEKGTDFSYDCWKRVIDENGNAVSAVAKVLGEDEWKQEPNASYIPDVGEYCFSRVGEVNENEPMRGILKIGDGVHTFSELNVLSSTDFDESLRDHFVPKSQLETPVVDIKLDNNIFSTEKPYDYINLSGVIYTNSKQICIDNNGKPYVKESELIPEKVIIQVIDFHNNMLDYQEVDKANLQHKIEFRFDDLFAQSSQNGYPSFKVYAIVDYKGGHYKSDVSGYIEYPSYYGKISNDTDIVNDIRFVYEEKRISNTAVLLGVKLDLNYERCCYVYPAYLRELTSIKDANNFEIISGFEKFRVKYKGIAYYIYAEKYSSTASNAMYNFKQ